MAKYIQTVEENLHRIKYFLGEVGLENLTVIQNRLSEGDQNLFAEHVDRTAQYLERGHPWNPYNLEDYKKHVESFDILKRAEGYL